VHLSDEYGNAVATGEIRVLGATTDISVRPDEPFHIAAGSYTVRVTVPGAKIANVPVAVDQLDQVIAVALQLGALEAPAPSCAVYGRITNQVPVSRVRLMELFGARSVDVPLSGAARTFDFRSIPCGTHLLVVMGPESCLGTLLVKAGPTTGELKIAPTASEGCVPLHPN
jgi:hypothetical protein